MRTEKRTVACQFPDVSLPECTLFPLLLFFMSKLAVTHFVCYSSASVGKKEKSRMALMVGNDLTLWDFGKSSLDVIQMK